LEDAAEGSDRLLCVVTGGVAVRQMVQLYQGSMWTKVQMMNVLFGHAAQTTQSFCGADVKRRNVTFARLI
jgi:hypothetical protein